MSEIINSESYQLLSDDDKSKYRVLWLFQEPYKEKWKIAGKVAHEKHGTFQAYSDHIMKINKNRAVKQVFIKKADPKPGDTIAVYFSCGAASAIAVRETIKRYSHMCKIFIVNNPIKEEDDDNQRFLNDIAKWLNVNIEIAVNSKYKSCSAVEVWEDRQYMSGINGAPCTLELKKKARYEWEIKNRPDWTVMGFTKEEDDRFDNFQLNERPASIYILEDITKGECFMEVAAAGIELLNCYKLGMPNANCKGCVKATSPTYWNHVRKVYPKEFKERAEQSREIGARLVRVNGERIFLDELDPNAKGGKMKDLNFECGIFCGI